MHRVLLLTAVAFFAMSALAAAQDKPQIQEEHAIEQLNRGSNPETNPTAKPQIQEENAIEQMNKGSNAATNPTAKPEIQEEKAIEQMGK
jgi:hypothetical protein